MVPPARSWTDFAGERESIGPFFCERARLNGMSRRNRATRRGSFLSASADGVAMRGEE